MEDILRLWAPQLVALVVQFLYLSHKLGKLEQAVADVKGRMERVERFIDEYSKRGRS